MSEVRASGSPANESFLIDRKGSLSWVVNGAELQNASRLGRHAAQSRAIWNHCSELGRFGLAVSFPRRCVCLTKPYVGIRNTR